LKLRVQNGIDVNKRIQDVVKGLQSASAAAFPSYFRWQSSSIHVAICRSRRTDRSQVYC